MRRCRQILLSLACLLFVLRPAQAQNPVPETEIVLLMDESGSMRRTDPARARIRSAELLVTLLQDRQKIGIVRFSNGSEVALPLQPAGDAESKDRIRRIIRSLGQAGEWTDINAGVELAARQFSDSSESEKILLLFTDGEVDLAEGPDVERRSVRQLRTATLEMCQERQISIHSLAYTEAADHALLRELADSTSGLFYKGAEAQSLHLLFMRISESVAKPQGIPIVNSAVMIDDSVKEATFVVTRINKSGPLTLKSPGETFSASTEAPPEGVRWFEAPEFDVVTIGNPQPGRWVIEPATGPKDRVQIVTDLELALKTPPALILNDDSIRIEAWLTSHGKPLKDPVLFSTLQMRGESANRELSFSLVSNPQGDFTWQGQPPSAEGNYRVAVVAEAKTFERIQHFDIEVRKSWAEASVENDKDEVGRPFVMNARLKISPQQLLETQIKGLVIDPKGTKYEVALPPVMGGLYSNAFTSTSIPGAYSVTVHIEAKHRSGQLIKNDFGPFTYEVTEKTISSAIPQNSPTPTPTPEPTPAPTPQPTPQPTATPVPSPTPQPKAPESHPVVAAQASAKEPSLLDQKDLIALILLVLLNIGGGFFFWNRLHKSTKAEKTIEERLAEAGKGIKSAMPPAQTLDIVQEEKPATLSELMLDVEMAPEGDPQPVTEPASDEEPVENPVEEPLEEIVPEEAPPVVIVDVAEQPVTEKPAVSAKEQPVVNSEEKPADTPVTGQPEESSAGRGVFMSSIDLTPEELAEALREATESEKF